MRRIIHNSTAIAASLALLMPQIAAAELRLPNEQAARQAEQRASVMPNLAKKLQAELAAGLTVEGLVCANGAARPCPDDVRLMTPKGVAVQVAQNDTIILAPRGQQENRASANDEPATGQAADEAPAVEAAVEAEAEAEATTDVVAGRLEKALKKKAAEQEAAAAEAEAAAAAETEEQVAQQAATEEDALAEALAAERLAAEAAAEAEAETAEQVAEETSTEDALAEALAAEREAAKAAAETDEPAVEADRNTQPQSDTNLQLAENGAALQRMTDQPGLARVLRAEVERGLSSDDLTCQTGEAQPCPEGVALMTPRGVAVQINDRGEVAILPPARQTNIANAEGNIVPRAPEADTVETAAAKEAAEAASAPAAAALEATEGEGRVVEQEEVTEANTRSSAEDFEASLRAALEQAGQPATDTGGQQQNAAAEDDDSDSDLAKALILGLGAVAVGSMLNNNRQVALSAPDRVVVQRADGSQEVIKDEVALLRQPGSTVTTENFDDGSSRTIVTRADGSKVVTIRDADLRVLRRTLISADGTSTMLIDDTADVQPVDVASLPAPAPVQVTEGTLSEDELRAALQREANVDRRFTLGQIRNIPEVRALVAPVNIDAITFDTGSAAINPNQAQQLATLGRVIQDAIAKNPREVFMIEGHTDTVGANAMNLALSDRRAESVALALSEYFDVPPENMVVQGYGEQFLKVRAEGDVRANRRASVRRITELLQTAQAN